MLRSTTGAAESNVGPQRPLSIAYWFLSGLAYFVLAGTTLVLSSFSAEVGEGAPIAFGRRLGVALLWVLAVGLSAAPLVFSYMLAWRALVARAPMLAQRRWLRVGSLTVGAALLPALFWPLVVMLLDDVAATEALHRTFHPAVDGIPSMWWASLLPVWCWIVVPQLPSGPSLRMRAPPVIRSGIARAAMAGALSTLAYSVVLGLLSVLTVYSPAREGTAFALPRGDALQVQTVQQLELGVVLSLVILFSVVHGLVTMMVAWRRPVVGAGSVIVRGVLAAPVTFAACVLAFTLLPAISFGPAVDAWVVSAVMLAAAVLPVPLVWVTPMSWRPQPDLMHNALRRPVPSEPIVTQSPSTTDAADSDGADTADRTLHK